MRLVENEDLLAFFGEVVTGIARIGLEGVIGGEISFFTTSSRSRTSFGVSGNFP
jgi:hypothetical protein